MTVSQEKPKTNDTVIPDGEVPPTINAIHGSDKQSAPAVNGVNDSHKNGFTPFNGSSIPLNNTLAYTPTRKLHIVTIGAGFSGLLLAHKFQHRFPEMQDIISHTIFESRHQLGGTWLVNTYPGVQCDVPSHVYVRDTLQFTGENPLSLPRLCHREAASANRA